MHEKHEILLMLHISFLKLIKRLMQTNGPDLVEENPRLYKPKHQFYNTVGRLSVRE